MRARSCEGGGGGGGILAFSVREGHMARFDCRYILRTSEIQYIEFFLSPS